MAAIPKEITVSPTVAAIYKSYEEKADTGHRAHLGASLIGHNCERHLWLTFRWALAPKFDGRMLRLFETGHKEELRLVSDLRRIGVTVHDTQPDGVTQWRVNDCGGHFGGSLDAAAIGLQEAPKTWHCCEFKTSNTKAFKELQDKGVRAAKPMHWFQMQTYMHLTGMTRAAYIVKCKETDQLYMERVHYEKQEAEKIIERALRVITAPEPPARIGSADWYECKFCHHAAICHGTTAPEANCRTCAHSTPEMDGNSRWSCAHHACDIAEETQRAGCADHRVIPILLDRIGTMVDASPEAVTYRMEDGREFTNGDPARNPAHLSSAEIHACQDKASLPVLMADAFVMDMRANFGGRIAA